LTLAHTATDTLRQITWTGPRAAGSDKAVEMSTLYVLGGRQGRHLFKNKEEWSLYEAALVLKIDTESGAVSKCLEYQTSPEARPNAHSSVLFKAGSLVDDRLYACTLTEVLELSLPDFQVLNRVSLRCFNDLHHVVPSGDGTLLAAVTGLDMVVRFTPRGLVLEEWNVLGEESPWARFSRDVDYRKVETTKPHQSHPNFVFQLEGEVWVTRLHQRDAVCLSDRRKRIEIKVEQPHDGLLRFGKLFFTLVDGRVVRADATRLAVEQIVDLKTIDNPNSLLGWCRGILPLTPSRWWVGFSRIRQTRFEEHVTWVRRVLKEGMDEEPTHVALYDPESGRRLQRIDLEPHGLDVIFSILSPD
jgi:hypothetical protein